MGRDSETAIAGRMLLELLQLGSGALERTFFANSGAEAVEGAVKLCMKHAWKTGRKG